MQRLRRLVFWIHLILGLSLGVVIFVMSATGVLLTYQRQVQWWVDTRGLDASPPSADAPRRPADELVERVTEERGSTPSRITWRSDPEAPVALAVGQNRIMYVNAYTGQVLGESSGRVRRIFRAILSWHARLGREGERRQLGRAATGAANLGVLFMVISGFYLWWPRSWRLPALRSVTLFQRGLSPRARDFNWHNVIGFWGALPLAIVVASGVVLSYRWAGELVDRVAGLATAETRAPAAEPPGRRAESDGAGEPSSLLPLESLFVRAEAEVHGWNMITIRLPVEGPEVTFNIDRGNGGQPQHRSQLVLDAATGDPVRRSTWAGAPPDQRLHSVLRFAHTGEVFGILGQTVAGLVSAGAAVLVWTGLSLAWRRFLAWRRRIRKAAA